MSWFHKFMQGRYGVDQFSFALLVTYFLLTLLGNLTRVAVISYFGLVIFIYCWYRILSKQKYKRSAENTRYLQLLYPIKIWVQLQKKKFSERKFYKYYKCPNCHQQLRVPKGKGELLITCPKCRTKFEKRT